MKKQLFPKEFLKHSVEVHQFKYSQRSRNIYWTLLFLLLFVILALPLVKVNVYTTVRGIIKPEKERQVLRVNSSGQVLLSQLFPNASVQRGDTLLRLAQPVLEEKKQLLLAQMNECNAMLYDLQQLSEKKKRPDLKTATYQKKWLSHVVQREELSIRKAKCKHDFERAQNLFEKEIIPKVEWEQAQHAYQLALGAEEQFYQRSLATWVNEQLEFNKQLRTLESNLKQLQQEQQAYCLVAPSSGTLLLSEGVASGSWVQAGQVLGELSPESKLIVEAYIPSHKIGQVTPHAAARYQVDAFNYRQWGMATGKVLDKGKDVELINQRPLFKVRCSIDQTHLQLANGVKGRLQKGLGLTVLLYHNRRSLFDLLFDDINDWINPNQPQNPSL